MRQSSRLFGVHRRFITRVLRGATLCVAFAICGWSSVAMAGDPASGNLVGHGGPVKAVTVNADGTRAITGSFDYSMVLWSLADKAAPADRIVRRFDDHDSAVNAVAFVGDGARIVSAGDDGSVSLWSVADGKRLHRFTGHTGKVLSLDVSADGTWVATASWDGTVRLWNIADLKPGPVFKGHRGPVNGVVFSPDGTRVYSASYDGRIGRWSVAEGALVRMIYKHGWGLNVLKVLDGGHALVFGSLNGDVGVVDAETGELVKPLTAHTRPVLSMALLAKPGLLATGGGDGVIRIYRTGDWDMLEEYRNPYGPVWAMDFAAGGTGLYYGGLDDFVHLWQVAPRKPFETVDSQFPRRFQVGKEVSLGERQFARKCSVCHTLKKDGRNRAGPTLHKVFGRKIGAVPGYPYSPALANGSIVWTSETLKKLFTLGPEHYTPGTKMPLQRITDPKKINALIAYLEVASEDPAPDASAQSQTSPE